MNEQLKPAVPETPPEELAEILAAQKLEAEWWKDAPVMQTEADIEHALGSGRAERVINGAFFRVSANVPEHFRVLDKETKKLLDEFAAEWGAELQRRNINPEGLFLVISSLARTAAYQEELRVKGYPGAEGSTHTKLGAFDIAVAWFEKNRPEVAAAVEDIAQKFFDEGRINLIREHTVGALHIARNPRASR
ncbi:MAG: DUF5715 family protein [bacterium]|nr:DUF5715 family protein [bacterium]